MNAHQKVLFLDAATGYYRITRYPWGDSTPTASAPSW